MSSTNLTQVLNLADEHVQRSEFAQALECAQLVLQELKLLPPNDAVSTPHLQRKCHAWCIVGACLTNNERGDEALEQYALARDLAHSIDDLTFQSRAISGMALVHTRRGEFHLALDFAQKSLTLAESARDQKSQALALGIIGNVHKNLSDYPLALEYMHRTLAMHAELNDTYGIAVQQSSLGTLYFYQSDYQRALECYQQALYGFEKLENQKGIASLSANVGMVQHAQSDFVGALEHYQKALSIHERIANPRGSSAVLVNIGTLYLNLADYARALEYYQRALSIEETIGNREGSARNLSGIGLVYMELSDYVRALEYLERAKDLNEALGNRLGVTTDIGNIGAVYISMGDHSRALEFLLESLRLNELLGNQHGSAISLSNLGEVYQQLSHYDVALEYYERALSVHESLAETASAALDKARLGALYAQESFSSYDELKAENYLLEAIHHSEALGTRNFESYHILSELYRRQERWKESRELYEKYHTTKEEVHSEEAKKNAARAEQLRQIAEREKEIAIAKARADAKHVATEQLLHSVLPQDIARQMLSGTQLIAENLPEVSVLFADIVGFTTLSQSISAEAIVRGLDSVFSAIDTLVDKYGLEKIKTIGDAYMVVSGAPIQRDDHATAMALFALELEELSSSFRLNSYDKTIQLRIGIHCGEAVAGVIGKRKFAYDLWGDTVNTASRMEHHGDPGKIHVSEAFATRLRSPQWGALEHIQLIDRGEIEIKGKGRMRTYFLERF